MRNRVGLLAVALACWAAVAPAQCRPSGRATFVAGLQALSRSDLKAAGDAFSRLLKEQPDCPEAHNNLAVVLVEQGQLALAAEHLRRAVQLRPEYQRARLNLQRVEAMLAAAKQPAASPVPTLAVEVAALGATATVPPAAPRPHYTSTATPAAAATPTATVAVGRGRSTAGVPSEVAALEPPGSSVGVIEPAQRRICVYRRAATEISAAGCFHVIGATVQKWPQWLLATDHTRWRIRMIDESGHERLKVVPEGHSIHPNLVRLRQRDFVALSAEVVPGRTQFLIGSGKMEETAPVVTALRAALESWRQAWEHKRFDAYAGWYAAGFAPQGEPDLARWREHKKDVFAHSGTISVQLSAPSIFVFGDTAYTSFVQTYRSGVLASRAFKVLRWQREGTRWMIGAETVLQEHPLKRKRAAGG
jgi:Tetratricopeptide repeat